MIEDKFIHSVVVQRLIINGDKETYGDHLASVKCMVQPLAPEKAILSGGLYKSAVLYCRIDIDIRETDKILYEGKSFIVKGTEPLRLYGENRHLKVTMFQTDEG